MKLSQIVYYTTIVLFFCATFLSCTELSSDEINNEDLIFNTSYPVNISTYSYQDSLGTVYSVQGDTTSTIPPDTLNNQPTLAWDSIFTQLVSAAIFKDIILVSGGKITNTTDIVWQWHSGMEFVTINQIQFSEGRNVINGEIVNQNPAKPLSGGHYYWAVWGWNNSGIKILYSSRQHEFYVTEW